MKRLVLFASAIASALGLGAQSSFFVQSSPFVSWSSEAPAGSLVLEPEAYYRYGEAPALAAAGWRFADGGLDLVFRLDFRADFATFLTKPFNTNIPFVQNGAAAVSDFNYPSVGFAAYDGGAWTASIGRRKLKWGPGRYGLAIGDGALYLDHAWLDYRLDSGYGSWWYNFVGIAADRAASDGGHSNPDSEDDDLSRKSFFGHKIGFENGFLRVAFAELNCVYDTVPSLVDAGPFLVYHHLYQDAFSNVLMDLSAEARLGPARLYGEFAMDDLNLSFENRFDKPTAMGWMAGAEWRVFPGRPFAAARVVEGDYAKREATFSEPGGLRLSFEHYRASTYLYNRDKATGKYALPSRLWTGGTYQDCAAAYYLGFEYGPDCSLDMLAATYESERLAAGLGLKHLRKGSYGIGDEYEPGSNALDWYDLAEPVTDAWIVELSASRAFGEDLRLWGRGELRLGDEPGAEIAAGLSYNLEP